MALIASLSMMALSALYQTNTIKRRVEAHVDLYDMGNQTSHMIAQDLSMAYLSLNQSFQKTGLYRTFFQGLRKNAPPIDRLAFTYVGHHRLSTQDPEADTAAVSYTMESDPQVNGTYQLIRSETKLIQPIDPTQLDRIATYRSTVCDHVLQLEIWYFNPRENKWVDTWTTTEGSGQSNRLPSQVAIKLVLQQPKGPAIAFVSAANLMMNQPIDNTVQ